MCNEKYYKPFSDDEIKFLYENNGQMSLAEVSEKLGRTEASLRYKIKNLNKSCPSNIIKMKRKQKKKPDVLPENWRPETNCTVPCICSAVDRGESFEQIANDIDRPIEQVKYIYNRSVEDGSYKVIKEFQALPIDSGNIRAAITRGRRGSGRRCIEWNGPVEKEE